MNSHFDLQSRLDAVYAQYPEAGCQPVIGITGNYDDLTCKLGEGYYKSVLAAGGVPLIIPPIADTDTILPFGLVRSLRRCCMVSIRSATCQNC